MSALAPWPEEPTPRRLPDSPAGCWMFVQDAVDERYVQVLEAATKDKSARWVPDPSVDRVWAFAVLPWATGENTDKVVMVVTLDAMGGLGDCTMDDRWFQEQLDD